MKLDICGKDYSKYVDISKYSDKTQISTIEKLLPKNKLIYYGL